jgi:hypothetical protein
MQREEAQEFSRRDWLGMATGPVLATAAGAVFAGTVGAAEPPALREADDRLAAARVYDVRDFGAKGDGKTLDTQAVQAAIDACNHDRGGTVLIPNGDFLVGTIELKSDVTLHLSVGGRLLGSPRREDYSAGKGVPPSNGNIVLLYAVNAQNITIEGRGTIDGQGGSFYTGHGDNTGPGGNGRGGNFDRPHLLVFYQCTNLLLRDAFFTRSAYHCCRILWCRYVRIDGIRIHNRVNMNNDGFHFNDSQYVNIVNCNVACQDDACALFGSNQFVTVTNCTFSTRWSIFRFGGGHAKDIVVSNCVIYETYGCPIKMRCGGGSVFENMLFSNLIMQDVTGPIYIGLDSHSRRSSDTQPASKGIVRNIAFRGMRGSVVTQPQNFSDLPFPNKGRPGEVRSCIVLNGVGEDMLEDITLSDIHLTFAGGGTAGEAAVRDVPKIAGEYFQTGTPPAYGVYARNVRGLTIDNVRLQTAEPDLRPAVVFDHVQDADVASLNAQGNPAAESVLRMIDSKDVLLTGPRLLSPAAVFLRAEGGACDGITVDGGDLRKAEKPMAFAQGAAETSVRLRA